MHNVPVMISTVTKAHTVSESMTVEQKSQVSRCRCIVCMQVTICKREKYVCLNYAVEDCMRVSGSRSLIEMNVF